VCSPAESVTAIVARCENSRALSLLFRKFFYFYPLVFVFKFNSSAEFTLANSGIALAFETIIDCTTIAHWVNLHFGKSAQANK